MGRGLAPDREIGLALKFAPPPADGLPMASTFDTLASGGSLPGRAGAASASKRQLKLLIADDDRLTRTILRSMLKQQSTALILETDNGAHALEIIDGEGVDAVFLDVRMPVMDGIEVLESLRADPAHKQLPVVMVSAHSEPGTVQRAIRLGITDYLVKPIQPLLMDARLQRVLTIVDRGQWEGTAHAAVRPTRLVSGGRRVLLVDTDVNFGAFFVGLFEEEFEIANVDNGRDAARIIAGWKPDVACLATGLRLPTEVALARKIHAAAPSCAIYLLCNEVGTLTGEAASLFTGSIAKTFIPGIFRRDFAQLVEAAGVAAAPPAKGGLLDDAMREAVVTATRQTLGVTMTQDVSLLASEAVGELTGEVWASVELRGGPEHPVVGVALAAPRAHVEKLAERMIGMPMTIDDGAADAFGELVNTVAGRIVSGIESRGLPLKIGLPTVSVEPPPDASPERFAFRLPFETDGGERFFVGVRMVEEAQASAA